MFLKKRVLINASNLHVGGGVQVATSFILELSKLSVCASEVDWSFYVSSAVDRNLKASGLCLDRFRNYQVVDVHGLGALNRKTSALFDGFDLVFTVFGPLYVRARLKSHLVGFAQPWIVYPQNEVFERLSFKQRLLFRVKFALQWLFLCGVIALSLSSGMSRSAWKV